MTPSTSSRSTFILLFYLLFPFIHASCPTKCTKSYSNMQVCKCDSNCFRQSRNGIQTCQRCTQMCSEDENQMEVTPCTQENDRVCYCKPGFYCSRNNNYVTYCHKPCVPCETGTFSSKPSLDPTCKPHKDCAQLGMITLNEGTATQDRECVSATTKMAVLSTSSSIITSISSNTTPTQGTEDENQMEVTPCTQENDRVCYCKPGFYCSPNNNYVTYCHKPCVPCETGTFSSKPSLDPACKPHKDCAQLGMITLKEGTATQDRECVSATTKMAESSTSSSISSNTTPTPSTVKKISVTRSLVKGGTATQDRECVNATIKMAASSTPSSIITSISSNTTPTQRIEGSPISRDGKKNESHWLLLLILLLMLLFMAGFCMLMKGKALKTLSKCFGLICGQHQYWRQTAGQHQSSQSNSSTNQNMENEIPLGTDGKPQSMGMTRQSGGVQQVTMEHNGKGENVSNSVGSIYIISPGMVVLGSNSGDKKEEAGDCGEALPLLSAPQQESNPSSQEVRIRMSAQEEAKEESSLSFPVPATGK